MASSEIRIPPKRLRTQITGQPIVLSMETKRNKPCYCSSDRRNLHRLTAMFILLFLFGFASGRCPGEAGESYADVRKYALWLFQQGRIQDSEACHRLCSELSPSRPDPWLSIADIQRSTGLQSAALDSYRTALDLGPTWPLAHFNFANALKDAGDPEGALDEYRAALDLDPPFKPAVFNNMALAYGVMGRRQDVMACYERALVEDPTFPETYNNLASHLQGQGLMDQAVVSYRAAVALREDKGFLVNLAFALGSKGDTAGSIEAYMRAIELYPDYALAYYNLGTTLMGEERYQESEFCYRFAVELDGTNADYYNNLATVVGSSGANSEVMELYDVVLGLHPGHETAVCNMYHTKHEICNWSNDQKHLDKLVKIVSRQLAERRLPTVRAFHALYYDVPGPFQRSLTEAWSRIAREEAQTMWQGHAPLPLPFETPLRRLRIGYTSSDLKLQHPVAHLVAALFQKHDLLSFEVMCFALTPSDGSEVRMQVEASSLHFVDLTPFLVYSVVDAAREINRWQPHVLVNLNGYTNGGRLEIYALNPAPVQMTAIGYPGTMGADYLHYLATDRISSPPESQSLYTEKLLFLPHTYLVNSLRESFPHLLSPPFRPSLPDDVQRLPPAENSKDAWKQTPQRKGRRRLRELEQELASEREYLGVSRYEWGLPKDKVVLACFNTLIKLRPKILRRWLSVLRRSPHAVLWLLRAPKVAEANVLQWWNSSGGDMDRLIFSDGTAKEDHIRRSGLADIFVDTDIYGAHSTGTDALWAGLPLLVPTYQIPMASRVSASLLLAISAPQLIARTLEDYEELAVALIQRRSKLLEIRERIRRHRWNAPLFDTARWMEGWERGLKMSVEYYLSSHSRGEPTPKPHVVIA